MDINQCEDPPYQQLAFKLTNILLLRNRMYMSALVPKVAISTNRTSMSFGSILHNYVMEGYA